jgi:A-kinase anchor protein 10
MQASNSLGVSDETRIRIENKICREGGPLPDCFEEPMENVLTLLEEVTFTSLCIVTLNQ